MKRGNSTKEREGREREWIGGGGEGRDGRIKPQPLLFFFFWKFLPQSGHLSSCGCLPRCFQVGEKPLDICFRSPGHGTGHRPAETRDHRTARTVAARPQKADRPFNERHEAHTHTHITSSFTAAKSKTFLSTSTLQTATSRPKICVQLHKLFSYTGKHTHRRNISQFTHPDTLILLTTCEQINVNSSVNKHFIFAKKK